MYPLGFCCATSMFLPVGLLHGYAGDKLLCCDQWRSQGERWTTRSGNQEGAAKMWVIGGASGIHDFWS